MSWRALILAALAAVLCVSYASAQSSASAPTSAQEVIARMLARDTSLASYESRVHVSLRMLNFPFLAPVLDGTYYYKRPDKYEIVFDRVPSYAKGFEKIFNDVGDPQSWSKDQNIEFKGLQPLDGHPMYVLWLTKKIHSDILDHTLVYVDPQNYELTQMEWHYTSGGSIVMTQQYREQDGYAFVGSQHVTIDIPHVHAIGDSQFGPYQTNVAVSNSVFTKTP
ncbi:MAG TPA: hypothetical protein VMF11_08325 [Candidatus Baltobacteraceae bacterium]|nr:hypothetical protein [Candidatus Baltobacteraceae bacterium]